MAGYAHRAAGAGAGRTSGAGASPRRRSNRRADRAEAPADPTMPVDAGATGDAGRDQHTGGERCGGMTSTRSAWSSA